MSKHLKKPTEIMTKTLNPRKLADEQYEAYKQYILDVLDRIKEKLELCAYTEIEKMTAFSGSGDGYGNDNYYIDFGFGEKPMDIVEAINYLAYLDSYAVGDVPIDMEYSHKDSWFGED